MWKLGDFKFKEELGRGKMGRVFRALEKKSQKEVALKIVPKSCIDKTTFKALRREVEVQARLYHPNIVRLYGYFQDEYMLYLVLEYLDGGDLFNYIKRKGKLDEPQTKPIVRGVLRALEHLNNLGVMHRDIKPENILLTSELTPKIADFGHCALVPSDQNKRYSVCGTLQFICPEMAESKGYNSSCDLWALGQVMYECLVGKPTWKINSIEEIPKLNSVEVACASEDCKDLIHKLLKKTQRPQVSEVISHKWLSCS